MLSPLGMVFVLAFTPIPEVYAQSRHVAPPNNVMFWHFADDNFQEFSDGHRVFFRLRYLGADVLWDPSRQLLTPWIDSYAANLTKVSNYENLVRQEPLRLDPDMTIEHHIASPTDGTSFNDYYKVSSTNDFDGSFLLVAGQGRDHFEARFCCEDRNRPIESLLQQYDTFATVLAIKLPSNLILLTVAAFDSSYHVQVYFIGIRAIPSESLAFSHSVFLFPSSLINPSLNAAGPSLRARYAIVSRFMDEAAKVKPSAPGPLVSASDFFSDAK